MSRTDTKIAKLNKGQTVKLSESNGFRVIAERSGNGKTGRIVRESRDGFVVLTSWKW